MHAEIAGIGDAGPASPLRIPALAGIWIDEDRLGGAGAQLCDQRRNPPGRNAVHADGDSLRERGNEGRAIGHTFTVRYVSGVAARKTEPRLKLRPRCQCLAHGAGFVEGREGFKRKQIGPLGDSRTSENLDALAMKSNKIVKRAIVIAVILAAVMERSAEGSERTGHEDAPARELRNNRARKLDRSQQGGIGFCG